MPVKMSSEYLMLICQVGMFLVQWGIVVAISSSLLKCKLRTDIKGYLIMMSAVLGPLIVGRGLLTFTKNIQLNIVLCAIMVIAFQVCFFKDSIKKRIFVGVLEFLVMCISEALTGILLFSTAKNRGDIIGYDYDSVYAYPEYVVLSSIYSTLLFLVLFMLLLVFFKGFADHFWIKEYLLYIMVPFYQLILFFIYYRNCDKIADKELTAGVLLVSFSLLVDFSIIYLVNGMLKKIQLERELTVLSAQRQAEQRYYEIAEKDMEEMEAIRCDFSNRLKDIYSLLEQGIHREEVKEILEHSSEDLRGSSLKRYCENAIVNAILTIKIKAAWEKNIAVTSNCSITENIGIEDVDLCSLFTNLMDNAIEACEKIQNAENRWISVKAGARGGYLTVKLENPYIHEILWDKGRILTNKNDRQNHGYGLKLIKEIADKYDGDMKINTQKSVFAVMVSLGIRSCGSFQKDGKGDSHQPSCYDPDFKVE